MITRRNILDRIAATLVPLYDPREARSIARFYVSEAAQLPVSALLADPDAPLAIDGFEEDLARLAAGCPVQYVTGTADFFGRRFAVREGVLIPRPETEELVAWIVANEPQARRILDIGTGSGCIAATLALELPGTELYAADLSERALETADGNCRALGARVTLRRADALTDLAAMHPNVRDHEPAEALFVPDDDPLLFYRAIARAGRRMLAPGGKLYFEIYHLAGDALPGMLSGEGYDTLRLREDINGKPRMLCARLR